MRIDFHGLSHPQQPAAPAGVGTGPYPPVPGTQTTPARVSIPVPLLGREVGAGQLVHSLTDWLGIKQCGGCAKREDQLDTWLRLRPMTGVTVRWDD
jgi:hypothetical protein